MSTGGREHMTVADRFENLKTRGTMDDLPAAILVIADTVEWAGGKLRSGTATG